MDEPVDWTEEEIDTLIKMRTVKRVMPPGAKAEGRPPNNPHLLAILDRLAEAGYVRKRVDEEGPWYSISDAGERFLAERGKRRVVN